MIWDFDSNPQPRQEEFLACSSGNLEKLLKLDFTKAANIVNGFNGLHMACKKGHTHIVQYLIQKSFETSANPGQCFVPSFLLSHTEGSQSKSGCMLAAFAGHFEIIKLFYQQNDELTNTLNQDTDDSGNSILHYSAWGGWLEITKYLIEQTHANLHQRNKEGMTPLQFAAAGNHVAVVEFLTNVHNRNIAINTTDDVVNAHDLNVVELPINDDDMSSSGLTTFHRAIQSGSLETVEYLLRQNSQSQNKSNNSNNISPETSSSSSPSSLLVSYVNMTTLNGTTGLHLACRHGHLQIAKCLLQHGANINQQNGYLLTPLHYACIGGYTTLVKFLVEPLAKVPSSQSSSELMEEEQTGKMRECADARMKISDNMTCLQLAAQNGKHDICELIISHLDRESDNILEKDDKGETAVSLALSSGYKELASKILTKRALAQLRAQSLLSRLMDTTKKVDNTIVVERLR